MDRDPFTKQITLTPAAVELLEKLQQEPGIEVHTNPDRLKEGERVFKAAFIDTEYPTVEDEEKLRKLLRAKEFGESVEVKPYKETQEGLTKNVHVTQEDMDEFLEQAKAKTVEVHANRPKLTKENLELFKKKFEEKYTMSDPIENPISIQTGPKTLRVVFPSEEKSREALYPNLRLFVDFGLARKSDDKDEDQMSCTITCKMTREWMERFLRFLDVMQKDGIIGHSETLSFFADGDGTFRPTFTVHEFKKEEE